MSCSLSFNMSGRKSSPHMRRRSKSPRRVVRRSKSPRRSVAYRFSMSGKKRSVRKSKSARKSSARKSSARKYSVASKARGCSLQHAKKYVTRPSPSYPANNCCGQVMVGNDGNRWQSRADVRGVCHWYKF